MEYLINLDINRPYLRIALFDFDGTISTLRHGWEGIMEPLMVEMVAGSTPINDELVKEIREYIEESTGIQTIYQMQWLAKAVKKHGRNPGMPEDPWWYKAEYNRRLMKQVEHRKASMASGEKKREDFLIKGSEKFLKALKDREIEIYIASGTDHPDVVEEASVLGLQDYFTEIAGAPVGRADCSKEAVLRKLIGDHKLAGNEVMVVGDGKVEIRLAREVGAITLGIASDENKLCGINEEKRKRLIKAGAHAIIGDFDNTDKILDWVFAPYNGQNL